MNRNQDNKPPFVPMQRRSVVATLEWADIVVIGNGIAGLTAAIEARRYDPGKRIVIMTDQMHATINTPALKQFAMDKLKRDQLQAYPSGIEQSLNINVVNARVEEIHAENKYLSLDGSRAFGYGRLLIATGSVPTGLPAKIPGRTFDGVMTLHCLKDYLDLRRRLPEVREAVVIGSGTHANETVMLLLHWGIRVHWLIRGKKFLSSMLDDTASELVLDKVQHAGAVVRTETEVASIVGQFGTIRGVVTRTGEMIPCQLLICCTGTTPAQDLAKQCSSPMMCQDGILVDGRLRTSVPDIYAAGDVAALPNLRTGEYETRAQWYSAVTQGKMAGAMLAGHSGFIPELFGAPWLATHLGKLSMLSVGDPLGSHTSKQTTIFTDTSGDGYRRLAVVGDRLVGYLSIGRARADGLSIKRFIDEGLSIEGILKPLLKGKFDAHHYLTHAKTRINGTRPLPALPALEAFQWPDTIDELQAMQWLEAEQQSEIQQWIEAEQPKQTLQLPAVESTIVRPLIPVLPDEPQEVHLQPAVSAGSSYQPGQLSPNVKQTSTGRAVIGQFIKPGFIDTRYNNQENSAVFLNMRDDLTSRATTSPLTKPRLVGVRFDEYGNELPEMERVTDSLRVGQLSPPAVSDKPQYILVDQPVMA